MVITEKNLNRNSKKNKSILIRNLRVEAVVVSQKVAIPSRTILLL
jgi:hypothetical protein